MFRFPWGDFHSLNLGWFLQKFNELREDWATAEAGIDGALDAEIEKAEDALSDVFAARDAAAASATAAAGSASSAGTSATAAQNSATGAASSATLANQKATAAGLSEAAAAQSATAAGNSATAAAGSASQAGQSATNAAGSATAAGNSASAAAASAASIEGDVDAAAASASAAAASAVEAGGYVSDLASTNALINQFPSIWSPLSSFTGNLESNTDPRYNIKIIRNIVEIETKASQAGNYGYNIIKGELMSTSPTAEYIEENGIIIDLQNPALISDTIRTAQLEGIEPRIYGLTLGGEPAYSPIYVRSGHVTKTDFGSIDFSKPVIIAVFLIGAYLVPGRKLKTAFSFYPANANRNDSRKELIEQLEKEKEIKTTENKEKT